MSDFFKSIILTVIIFGTVAYLIQQIPQLQNGNIGSVFSFFNPFNSVKTVSNSSKTNNVQIDDSQIPSGFTRNQLSSYFGKGKIDVNKSDSEILIDFNFDANVDVSGWKIKTNNNETFLPLVVNDYGVVASPNLKNLIIPKVGEIKIYSGSSATGRNFRLNKCVGFLNDQYSFSPKLPEDNCPEINRGEYATFSGSCQTYILSLGKCRIPQMGFISSLPNDSTGNTCRNFLSNINYSTCSNSHKNDFDFYSNEWWIWNNKNILDSEHDWVRLFDNKGLLVDSYIY